MDALDTVPGKTMDRRQGEKIPDMKEKNYLIRAGVPLEERYIGNAHIFSSEEISGLLKNAQNIISSEEILEKQYEAASNLKNMEKMQQIDINNWLPGDILQKADRMSMANSLEVRVPYLDYDVFDFARKLPIKAKIRKGQTKYIFRRVASKKLPEQIADRKKLGFPVPIRIWILEEPWKSEIKKAFVSDAARRFFNIRQLLVLLEEHVNKKKDNSRKIWTVYMFLVWYRIFFEENDNIKKFSK